MYFCGYVLVTFPAFAIVPRALIDVPTSKNPSGHVQAGLLRSPNSLRLDALDVEAVRGPTDSEDRRTRDVRANHNAPRALIKTTIKTTITRTSIMHFTGAVAAGEELCKGIGTAGFEYASDLIGGEW